MIFAFHDIKIDISCDFRRARWVNTSTHSTVIKRVKSYCNFL